MKPWALSMYSLLFFFSFFGLNWDKRSTREAEAYTYMHKHTDENTSFVARESSGNYGIIALSRTFIHKILEMIFLLILAY